MTIDIDTDVRFPTRASDWVETLLVGTLLLLFGGFVLPLLPLYGHLVRVARAGMAGDQELPPFADWQTLFVDGLKGLVVTVVYQLPPFLIGVGSFAALVALGSGNEQLSGAGILVFVLGVLTATLLALVFGYLGGVGVLAFAAEDDLGAAFDLGLLRAVALDRDYAISWGYGVVLLFAASLLFGTIMFGLNVVAIVPIIGVIIALLALFVAVPVGTTILYYAQLVVFRVWGRGYAAARDLDARAVPPRVGADAGGTGVSGTPAGAASAEAAVGDSSDTGTGISSSADGPSGVRSGDRSGGDGSSGFDGDASRAFDAGSADEPSENADDGWR